MTKISIWFNFPMENISVKLHNALTEIFKTDTNFCIYTDNVYYYSKYIKPIINNSDKSIKIKCIWSISEFDFSEEAQQYPEIEFIPINDDISLKTHRLIDADMNYVITYVIPILHYLENQYLKKQIHFTKIINLYTNDLDSVISEFINTLSYDKQIIIDMQEKGINTKLIAEQLGISINAVYKRATSVRKDLTQLLVAYLSK